MRWCVVALCLAGLVGVGTGRTSAQSPSSKAGAADSLDKQIHDLLRPVINAGADIYNRKVDNEDVFSREMNRAGCYRLYQGSLLTLRPLLAAHPDLQERIDKGLADAETKSSMGARAFRLREVLDDLRDRLKPATTAGARERPQVTEQSSLAPLALWTRLGGEPVVRKIVDDWLALAGPDPKVNFTRGGKIKLTEAQLTELKKQMVAFLSQATGGPLKYTGKTMESAHKEMNITDAEFTAAIADLQKAVEGRGIKPAEVHDLLQIVEGTRKDIVRPAKAASPKKDETKPGAVPNTKS